MLVCKHYRQALLQLSLLKRLARHAFNALLKVSIDHHQVVNFRPSVKFVEDFSAELVHLVASLHKVYLLEDFQVLEQLTSVLYLLDEKLASLLLRPLKLLDQACVDKGLHRLVCELNVWVLVLIGFGLFVLLNGIPQQEVKCFAVLITIYGVEVAML